MDNENLSVDLSKQAKRDVELHAKSVLFNQRLAEIRLHMAEEGAFADWTDEEVDSWRAHSTGQVGIENISHWKTDS